jgi:hypothetical protein
VVKLSETQRSILENAPESVDDQDDYFRHCVYQRNLTGLVRIGAVELVDDRYRVTRAAIEQLD